DQAAHQHKCSHYPPTTNDEPQTPHHRVHPTIVTSALSESRSRAPSCTSSTWLLLASEGVLPSTARTASVDPSGDQSSGRSILSSFAVNVDVSPVAFTATALPPPSRFIDAIVRSPLPRHAGLNSPRATPVLGGPACATTA